MPNTTSLPASAAGTPLIGVGGKDHRVGVDGERQQRTDGQRPRSGTVRSR